MSVYLELFWLSVGVFSVIFIVSLFRKKSKLRTKSKVADIIPNYRAKVNDDFFESDVYEWKLLLGDSISECPIFVGKMDVESRELAMLREGGIANLDYLLKMLVNMTVRPHEPEIPVGWFYVIGKKTYVEKSRLVLPYVIIKYSKITDLLFANTTMNYNLKVKWRIDNFSSIGVVFNNLPDYGLINRRTFPEK